MKQLLLAALLGVMGIEGSTSACPACLDLLKEPEVKTSKMGKLVRKVYFEFGPKGDFAPPVAIVVWELHVGDEVFILDLPEPLLAQARKLEGELVNVTGDMTLNGIRVDKLDKIMGFIPLPPLPDLKAPKRRILPVETHPTLDLLKERLTTLSGKLIREMRSLPQILEQPPLFEIHWYIEGPDGKRTEIEFGLNSGLEKKAEKYVGLQVRVSGSLARPDNLVIVESIDEIVAWLPLPILPQIERDLRGPDFQLPTPELKETDVFGVIHEGPNGFTLTTDGGKVIKVLVLCGNDDALLKKARRLQTWRFGVQARGMLIGDTLILSDIWPAELRGVH
jgi:hypothetical protein